MCKLRNIAFKLLDLLNDYYIQENPIFFHIFSNNGSFVYSNAVKVLFGGDARFQDFQVCGVVIDSAPGKPRLLSAARALSSSQQAGTFKYYIAMLAMVFYLIFKYAKAWLLATYDRNHKQNDEYFLYDTMKNDQSRWPQMYLYSIADKVISFSDVEEMVEHREKLGVHVDSMCWEDSQHVCHYRCYPEQYRQACWDFLSFCLDTLESAADSDALEETDDYLLIRNK